MTSVRRWGAPARIGLVTFAGTVLLVGCSWFRSERARMLPVDHDAPLVYAALGDSTVEGVGASHPDMNYVSRIHGRLRGVYPRARVANLGVTGATSADVLAGQLTKAVQLAPHLVTLSIGPNDLTGRVPLEQYERNVDTILKTLVGQTTAVIVVNLLPDLAVTPRFAASPEREAVAKLTERFNQVLARKAKEHGAEVVDLHSRSRAEVPQRPELVAGDGYHPSDTGYARWAELMWEGVAARLPRG